jgi:rhamnosyltransferase
MNEIKNFNVLVLMASYNGEKHLREQIESIFSQKNCNISLLVSDDCSSDKTLKLLLDLKSKYYDIEIISNKRKSEHSGQNFYNLITKCDTEDFDFIAFSDQDDIFHESKFITQINRIKDNSNVGSSSAVKCFGYSNNILCQSFQKKQYDYLFEGAGQGCSFLLKKQFFSELQNFVVANISLINNFIFHDWLTYLYARAKGYSWCYIKIPLLDYRIHNSNSFGNKHSLRGIFLRLKKIFNGWYFKQVLLANEISRRIDKDIPDFHKLNFLFFLVIIFTKSRRKFLDRIFVLIAYCNFKIDLK